MDFKRWVNGYLVHVTRWYDGRIYCNVQYFRPGQSIHQPPALDKSICMANTAATHRVLSEYLDSLVAYIVQHQHTLNETIVF